MKKRPRADSVASGIVRDYRDSFVRRVHELLKLGYHRMRPEKLSNRDEEQITEKLVAAIDDVLDNPGPAIRAWADYFSIHEEKRIRTPGRHGRQRLRIDIRIDSAEVRPRARFSFEAKRLGNGHPAAVYLGVNGLGAFLSGAYAANDLDAGMIGYIQRHDGVFWASEIGNELTRNLAAYCCHQGGAWNHERQLGGLPFVFSSIHARPAPLLEIRVFHTLLRFN